jgi:hypothetical protein
VLVLCHLIGARRDNSIQTLQLSRARRAIHCFDLEYPQEEKPSWDAVVSWANRPPGLLVVNVTTAEGARPNDL